MKRQNTRCKDKKPKPHTCPRVTYWLAGKQLAKTMKVVPKEN